MKLQTEVGQIHLTHQKDKNYASVFEEVFSKHGKKVELFAVIEVEGGGAPLTRDRRQEYENLTKTIVSAYKKAYVGANSINEATFEKALGSVNSALSKLAGDEENQVSWFGKTNAVLGAFYDNRLSLSATGKGAVYLLRDHALNLISEQDEEEPNPIKVFANYATGGLTTGDRVLLTGGELFNHLSMQRIGEFVSDGRLDDACAEIIENLKDIKDAGFAAFLFETQQQGKAPALDADEEIVLPEPRTEPSTLSLERFRSKGNFYFVLVLLATGLKKLFDLLKFLVMLLLTPFRKRSSSIGLSSSLSRPGVSRKKLMFIGLLIAIVILVASIAVAAIRKSTNQKKEALSDSISQIELSLDEAEAALIYQDEERATVLLSEAEDGFAALLQKTESQADKYPDLSERLENLKNKVQKQTVIQTPTVLTEFQNIPTDLIRSPNGFLGHNRNTGTISFYDFRTGESKQLFAGQNLNDIILVEYVGGSHGYVALKQDGSFAKLDLSGEQLTDYETEPALGGVQDRAIKSLIAFGTGDTARLYALDTANSQIYRMDLSASGVAQAQAWLKAATNFSDALDIAIDGNIFVLSPDELQKYFNGSRQTFSLAPLLPEIKNASKVYTSAELDSIYVLDPDNKRVAVFDKGGALKTQILSDDFRDLSDLYVDESNNIVYVLSGSRLLQVDLQ